MGSDDLEGDLMGSNGADAPQTPPPTPATPATPEMPATPPVDPVRARRKTVAKWTNIATRIGYVLYAVAIVVFFVAFATEFSSGKVAIITASMIVGSLLLAPAIVLGYAIKAAEKDDIARGL